MRKTKSASRKAKKPVRRTIKRIRLGMQELGFAHDLMLSSFGFDKKHYLELAEAIAKMCKTPKGKKVIRQIAFSAYRRIMHLDLANRKQINRASTHLCFILWMSAQKSALKGRMRTQEMFDYFKQHIIPKYPNPLAFLETI